MRVLAAGLLCIMAAPALARDALGVFDDWAAFRDPASGSVPMRCYAIAAPARGNRPGAFATIAHWPSARVRGQFHATLPGLAARSGSLIIAERSFPLVARGTGLWAPDARTDAAIVAAMRSATTMRVSAGAITATWRLRGAATAIDAAALGCVRR